MHTVHRHFKKVDPVMADLMSRITIKPRRRKKGSRFQALVQSILSQQLSTKVADVIIARFINLYKPKKFPTPEDVLKTKDEKIRSLGISYSKISYIKNLAEHITKKKIRLQSVHTLPDEELIEHLVQVKGIGRWTAEMFMMFMLERPNVFSHGDLGLKNAIIRLYKLKDPSQERIERIVAKWSPYKTIASRYLWASLDNE
jgi:DNA-3-methyladenine glycosylase II